MNFKRKNIVLLSAMALAVNANAQYTATGFTGMALKPFLDMQSTMTQEFAKTSLSVQQASQNTTAAIGAGMSNTSKTILQTSIKSASDYSAINSAATELEINHNAELAAQEVKSVYASIPQAEKEFLLEFLRRDDMKSQNIEDVIHHASKNVDGIVKVVHKPATAGEKFPDGKGTETVFVDASRKIAHWAKMCSDNKASNIKDVESTIATATTSSESARTTMAVVESTNSGDVAATRLGNQKRVSCTPTDMQRGLCGEMTEDEYLQKVVKNEIIPNGNLSSSNFYSPQSYGGAGYLNLSDPKAAQTMNAAATDALAKVESGGVQGMPEIVYTYRNSNQLSAARSFSENIVNAYAVSNQETTERTKPSSAAFQSQFLSRQASLNLAQNSFDQSLAARRGATLSKVNATGTATTVKESEDGAGDLDKLSYKVLESMKRFSPENAGDLAAVSDKELVIAMIKEQGTENEILFKEILALERQELLLAALLANEVNSPANIKQLSGGR